jgi:hypothetical protein
MGITLFICDSVHVSPQLECLFFPLTFCVISCILYLTLPRVRDLFLHWKSRFCGHTGQEGGGARNGTDSNALRQGRHAIGLGGHRIQKARYHWPWAVGAGVVGTVGGGEGWGRGMKGRGVAYFLPQTCADIYTGVFQKYVFCS